MNLTILAHVLYPRFSTAAYPPIPEWIISTALFRSLGFLPASLDYRLDRQSLNHREQCIIDLWEKYIVSMTLM